MKEEDQPLGGGGGLKLKLRERDLTAKKIEEEEELSPSIKLGLGIGANHVIKHKEPTFTAAQLSELHQQALIFKYMAAGLPVPPQLVFPIWRSVALSVGAVVAFNPRRFDYREMTEPEPGRCRRTDGKKWRCSKSVIPDRKYCEQHIHRGRQCSRKPEEPPQPSKNGTTQPNDSKKPVEARSKTTPPSDSKGVESAKSFVSDPVNLQLAIPTAIIRSSCETAVSVAVASYATTSNIASIKGSKICANVGGKAEGEENICARDVVMSAVRKRICPGLGFSPNSVLQVHGCAVAYKNQQELEPGRCRRTDGKKWRCSRDVLPEQKYCLRHMNRGAKKPVVTVKDPSSSSIVDSKPSRCTISKKEDGPALSTNLSIAIPSPYFHSYGEKGASSSSSSSDATISDTSIVCA